MMLSTDIAIDLGTSNTLIYEKNKGIVLNEPSIIAINKKTQKIIDTGNNAYQILGKEPKNIQIIYPFKNGVIEDIEALDLMINEFIKKIKTKNLFVKPRILVSTPPNISSLEKEIIKEIFYKIGARKVHIESSIIASAIGIGMNISEPSANMIIDIGGTTTDIAVLSLNDIVKSSSIKIGGQTLNDDIIKYIKEKYKVLIGEPTAENLKISYIDLCQNDNYDVEIKGKDLISGLPTMIKINKSELNTSIKENVNKIIKEIINILEQTPPELSADIVEKGIVITGGTSKLKGLLNLINKKTNVPIFIAEYPQISAIEGCEILLNESKFIS